VLKLWHIIGGIVVAVGLIAWMIVTSIR